MPNGEEASNELYRWMVDSSTDAYWMTDRDGRMVFANPRLAELLDRPFEDVRTMSAYEMFDEAGRGHFAEHLADLETRQEAWDHVEVLLVRRDGSPLWTTCSTYPVVDDGGRRVGWMHRLTEFTALRDLNEKLRASEHELAEAQRVARIGSWVWSVAERSSSWSAEFLRLLRIPPGAAPATAEDYLAYVHPDDRHVPREAVAQVLAGADEISFTVRMLPRGGGLLWVRQLGVIERDADGNRVRVTGTAQDVTGFKLAEEAAGRANTRLELLRLLAATANSANSLAEALTIGAAELARASGWRLLSTDLVGPGQPAAAGDGPGDGRLVAEAVRRGETAREGDRVAIPVLHGGRVVCVVALACEPGGGNEPDPLLLPTMEQALRQLSWVAEREQQAAALAAARDEAVEADRLKSDFLSTMSHEIRTPMNGVIGLTDLLLRTSLDPHQQQLADGLHSTGRSLLELINDILDLSKIEAGGLELEVAEVDLRALFARSETVLAESARRKGLQLSVEVDPSVPPRFRGDPGRLAQVVLNLGANAVRFTERGSVTIAAAPSPADPARLRIEVTDTGIGIAVDQRDRLFEPFVQADPSTTRRHGGTGLGLAICRRLVTAMGGEIGLTSTPGQGSTFWFTVPVGARVDATDGHRPAVVRPGLDARARRGQTILVAEDNPVNQLVARGLLETLGFDVELVGNGREAVTAVATATGPAPYAAVLMDCRMPVLDGYDASREIRAAEPAGVRLPLIALSASVLADERRRCLAAGMDDFVAKPVDLAGLSAALDRWVPAPEPPEDHQEPGEGDPGAGDWAIEQRVDRDRQRMLAALVTQGSSLLDRVVAGFVQAAPDQLAAVERAVAERDGPALEAAAHRLKGGAGNVGLPRLASLAAALEDLGERSFVGEDAGWPAERLVEALRSEQRAVLAELDASKDQV